MITRVRGIRVGHWTDVVGLTGCTVVLCPPGTVGSGEVRGGSPGTRETDLLRPGMLVQEVHAVLLTGGSAFGLAAAEGVMRFLEEHGIGFDVGVARVPIVPAAVLFDLSCGSPDSRPGPQEGYAACEAATDGDVPEGNVGAGTGATVAKLHGPQGAVKGGLGTASVEEDGVMVGALAAVNALGEILNEDDSLLAAARVPEGAAPPEWGLGGAWPARAEPPPPLANTTLVVVATNARLSKERANLLARAAHEAISRAIRPSHTMWDGDTAFALATGEVEADQRALEAMAERAVADSIRRAVLLAASVQGFPAVRDLGGHA